MKKTIGKNTIGGGKKMQTETRSYERSTHDRSFIFRSTMAPGTLVPFLVDVALLGDTWDINLEAHILTHPTIGPLFGSFKVQMDVFTADMRLYQGKLHNNANNIGLNMANIKLPQLLMEADDVDWTKPVDNQQINPSCIYKYLGISGLGYRNTGSGIVDRTFNALPLLAYADIYKNYYANKQEEIGAVIHNIDINKTITNVIERTGDQTGNEIPETGSEEQGANELLSPGSNMVFSYEAPAPNTSDLILIIGTNTYNIGDVYTTVQVDGTGLIITATDIIDSFIGSRLNFWGYAEATSNREPNIVTFPLENIDEMREDILADTKSTEPFYIDSETYAPYGLPLKKEGTIYSKTTPLEGLFLKTYQSDIFNNWINTDWITGVNGINAVTAISTTGGGFSIDTLTIKRKVYNMLNDIAVSGGSYFDWLEVNVDEKTWGSIETPEYQGGLSKELIFQEVISNSATNSEGGQPLGTLAGRGVLGKKHKGGYVRIKPSQHCMVIGIISLTPRIDYSQGNEWYNTLQTMDDFHKPALDNIGFQDVITDQMAWWDTSSNGGGVITYKSAGKLPPWINYQTNYNKVFGNFAIETEQMFMTLNRKYEADPATKAIKDLTTYIDPVKYNQIFAYTKRDAQNFWVQIGVNMEVRRKMSANEMPKA